MAGRAQTSAQRTAAERWAAYLRHQLAVRRWQQADLIRAAGTGPDGKPALSSSRVSQWVNGKEAASPDYAVIVARALNVPDAEALRATTAVESHGGVSQQPAPRYAGDDDEAFIARLRASSDPKMHELANRFEADLERVRRLTRVEYNEIQRERTEGDAETTGADNTVDKTA